MILDVTHHNAKLCCRPCPEQGPYSYFSPSASVDPCPLLPVVVRKGHYHMLNPAYPLDPSYCACFFHCPQHHIVVHHDSTTASPCLHYFVVTGYVSHHMGLGLQLDTDLVHSSLEVLDF